MIAVTGNTYPVKDELKAMGAAWDKENSRWILSDDADADVRKIRVPVGGSEELWEPCEECGTEPVDASGLCRYCRGTESLRVERVLSDDDEAKRVLKDIRELALALYNTASKGEKVETPQIHTTVGKGIPFGGGYGGYHVELLTDGVNLFARYINHYDGDRCRTYMVDSSNFLAQYRIAVKILISQHAPIDDPDGGEKAKSADPTPEERAAHPNETWIRAYSRKDGTKVRGHWRRLPGRARKVVQLRRAA